VCVVLVAEWFALWAFKVGSSSPSVSMMFSHFPSNNVMVFHLTSPPHQSTQLDGYLAFTGGQIPLTMSHQSAEGSGGSLNLVPTPVS